MLRVCRAAAIAEKQNLAAAREAFRGLLAELLECVDAGRFRLGENAGVFAKRGADATSIHAFHVDDTSRCWQA
jgi:hypothetical protein